MIGIASGARLALIALLLGPLAAAVEARTIAPRDVPNPRTERGSWVADVSGVLGPDAERSIDAIASELQRTTSAEIAVVTVPETGARSPKQFATELLERWGIGDRERHNGVLVLIATEPRRVEVETGYGAEAVLPDGRVGRILDTYVIPLYRAGDWDGGTVACVREMAAVLARPDSGGATPMPYASAAPAQKGVVAGGPINLWTLLVALLVLSAGLYSWLALVRSRQRSCEQCRRPMRRLTPAQEGAYLSNEESTEEALRSVNHVVWRCDDCRRIRIEHRRHWFSRYTDCPRCKRRTLGSEAHTIVAATFESAGSREVTRACRLQRCGFTDTRREAIPRLQRSASSGGAWSGGGSGGSRGGGSFGGGRSGGGGAGRSW